MKKYYLIALTICLMAACHPVEEVPAVITACTPMPEARTAAVAVGYGDSAFVFFGRKGDSQTGCNSSTFYCYHADQNTWTGPYQSPLSPREQACAITIGDKIYVGLGFDGIVYRDTSYLTDWWCFDPRTRQWDSLAAYPTQHTVGAIAFTQGGLIYCCYGAGPGQTNYIECYNPRQNQWGQTISAHAAALMGCAGAMVGGRIYIGTGYSLGDQDNWYCVNIDGSATKCKACPTARSTAVAVAGRDCIYLIGGRHFAGSITGGDVYGDILRYHPESDSWDRLGYLPEGTNNAIAFRIGNHSYVGLGETYDLHLLNTLYRIDE